MATTVTFNGTSYSIPANREPRGWGTSLSSFLVDVAGASLSKAGGTFTLTADVNFGATYGLKAAYYKSLGTVAAAGQVRLANAESVSWRNAANGADLALKANASDYLEYGGNRVVTVGDTGTVTSTMILDGTILNADINASAAIVDTKLDTISTALKVSNSATTATSANTASAIVARDVSGNFTAGTITANLTGNASGTSGSTTGNAATATALATARAINGTNFDGTAAITVTAAAGTLTGTTLNATVVTSSLTTVGALNSGSITSGFGAIDIGADALTAGATNITTLVGSDTTDSSSSTTGAFKTAGGLGVAKQLVVGTNTIIGGSTKVNTFLERTLSIQSPTSGSLEQAGIEIVGDSVSVGDLSSAILFSDNNSAEAHKRYAMIAGYAASAGAITAGGQLAFHTSTTGNTLTEVGRVNEAGAWTFPLIHNIGAGNITSGTYTPTITNGTNVASSIVYDAQYLRVGNVVTVSGYMSLTATAGAPTATDWVLTLPIASALTSSIQLSGTFSQEGNGTVYLSGKIEAASASDKAQFLFTTNHTNTKTLTYTYTYVVL